MDLKKAPSAPRGNGPAVCDRDSHWSNEQLSGSAPLPSSQLLRLPSAGAWVGSHWAGEGSIYSLVTACLFGGQDRLFRNIPGVLGRGLCFWDMSSSVCNCEDLFYSAKGFGWFFCPLLSQNEEDKASLSVKPSRPERL